MLQIIFYIKRLYRDYVRKYLNKIVLALFLSFLVAGTTSAIAWLLDPAIKKIFIENDKTYAFLIPILIIMSFSTKGISLYLARSITIVLGARIKQQLQNELASNILLSDTETLESLIVVGVAVLCMMQKKKKDTIPFFEYFILKKIYIVCIFTKNENRRYGGDDCRQSSERYA